MEKGNLPEAFYDLPEEQKEYLLNWIYNNLIPIKSFNVRHSSYRLKHYIEQTGGPYFTNGEFKGAMREAGFKVRDENELNWIFNISERSPIIVEIRKIII